MSPSLKTYTWISLWFLITTPVVLWDAGYCFMRPRSFEGGDLHWIWKPYALYQKVDLIYSPQAYQSGDGFTNAQSFLNLIETALNVAYLYLAHISQWAPAALIGFASAVMTLSKTLLYVLQEYYCNYCSVGHNTLRDIIVLWILPGGLWIVFPGLIIYQLGKDIIEILGRPGKKVEPVKSKQS